MPAVEGVNVEVQIATPAVEPATSGQSVNVPETPLALRTTSPVGVVAPVAEVSVTVAVHMDPWFTTTGVSQKTLVVVVLGGAGVTVMLKLEKLAACQ